MIEKKLAAKRDFCFDNLYIYCQSDYDKFIEIWKNCPDDKKLLRKIATNNNSKFADCMKENTSCCIVRWNQINVFPS